MDLVELRNGASIAGLNRSDVYQARRIPLPPIDVQKEMVAEIESCQIKIARLTGAIKEEEDNILAVLGRVWEDEPPGSGVRQGMGQGAELARV